MREFRREYLIFIAIIILFAVFGFGLFYALSTMIRQTKDEALTPVAENNQNLQTRLAQVLNPTPTVIADPITIIHEVRSLARLETIQYTLEKVITAESGQGDLSFLFGDKLLFVAHGRVVAGVDMAKMRPEDMWVKDQVLYVRLPQAEVFISALDNEKSYVYNRDTGLLTKGDVNLESTARAVAEKEIRQAAVDDGILQQAQQNAESYLSRLFRGLGYPDVVFVRDATPVPQVQPTLPPVAP